MAQLPPAGWYPEPSSPTGQRYWDGTQWTQHVSPPPAQQAGAGPKGDWHDATMLSVPVVHIEQRGRIVEPSSFYSITDPTGTSLGRASQTGQGRGGRLMKAVSDLDRNLSVTLEFTDANGTRVMTLKKPGGVGPQRFALLNPAGAEVAQFNQRVRVVREAFEVVVGGQPAGFLASQNWRDRRFSVVNPSGQAYATVHKLYEGYARAAFTSADRYVVETAQGTPPVLRAVAIGSALAMDVALYQS